MTWAQGFDHLGFLKLKNRTEVKTPNTTDDDRSGLRSLFLPVPRSTVSVAFSVGTLVGTKGGLGKRKGTVPQEMWEEGGLPFRVQISDVVGSFLRP